jgi:hypothetical protein
MIQKHLAQLFARFLPKDKKVFKDLRSPKDVVNPQSSAMKMGRWNIDYCQKKTNHKIDWSNEDHCGPCGQHALVDTPMGEKKPRFPDTK